MKRESEDVKVKDESEDSTSRSKKQRITQTADARLDRMLDLHRQETRGAKLGSGLGVAKKPETEYSTTIRATRERERKLTKSKEELEVDRAGARDRQARRQAKMKILASTTYKGLDEAGKKSYLEDRLRVLSDVRDTKGVSAMEVEFMHWKAEQERRKVDEDRAHLEFDEIIKKRKEDAAAAGLNGDDQEDAARPYIKAIWEPLIKKLERRVANDGLKNFEGVLWGDGQEHATEEVQAFLQGVSDPHGIHDPTIEYPITYAAVRSDEWDNNDDLSLTIHRYQKNEAEEVDEEELDELERDDEGDLDIVVGGTITMEDDEDTEEGESSESTTSEHDDDSSEQVFSFVSPRFYNK